MKKLTMIALGISLTATAFAGVAYGEQANRPTRDADGNGVLTRAGAQSHAAAMFARMDVNKDGKLDQADRAARRDAAFDRIDTDKNGQISRTEFATPPQRGPEAGAPGARTEDREGGRHFRGGWGGRGHHGGHDGRGPRGGMSRDGGPGLADANKDGVVTQAEFTAAATQRFDRLDANKDGQVTREERQAARQQMRAEWQQKRAAAAAKPAN
jgi:Ca2+-binding EF-hand superfamily protein